MRGYCHKALSPVDRITYRRWVRNVLALYLALASIVVVAVAATREHAPAGDALAAAAVLHPDHARAN